MNMYYLLNSLVYYMQYNAKH